MKNFLKLDQILTQLQATTKRNEIASILEENKDFTPLREYFRLALDPFLNYNNRKSEIVEGVDEFNITLEEAFQQIEEIATKQIRGSANIELSQEIISKLPTEFQHIVKSILDKDPDCGVQTSTANKVWKKLIPVYDVMLASPGKEKNLQKLVYPLIAQIKYDGGRLNAIVDLDSMTVEYRTRNGKPVSITSAISSELLEISQAFQNKYGISRVTLDGELIIEGNLRATGNGVLQKCIKGTVEPQELENARFVVWDWVDTKSYVEKTEHLSVNNLTRWKDVCEAIGENNSFIRYGKGEIVNSFEEANTLFLELLSEGEEGLILKNIHGTWEPKRSKHLVKLKGEFEGDFRVIAINEGKPGTRNVGTCGSLTVITEDGVVESNVGTGLSDELRAEIWNNKEKYMDQVVAVKYMEINRNKNGEYSIYLPVFSSFRFDKDKANTLEELENVKVD